MIDRTLLDESLLAWPDASATVLAEDVERISGSSSVVLTVPFDATVLDRERPLNHVTDQLAHAIVSLYPAWLREAEGIFSPAGSGSSAVRSLAEDLAERSNMFLPFLVRAADAGLRSKTFDARAIFTAETIVREGYKLILRAYNATRAILILELSGSLTDLQVESIQETALWLASQTEFRTWITGPGSASMMRIRQVTADSVAPNQPEREQPRERRQPYMTPLAGQPNPLSRAELRLEEFLANCRWAVGRAWNQTWSPGVTHNPIRVDLLWEAERCVIEIDGADHLEPVKYAKDRARDRNLQMAGYNVLRFTNEDVLDDVERVSSEIEQFLNDRRKATT